MSPTHRLVIVNGNSVKLTSSIQTICDIVTHFKLKPDAVVVEINDRIVPGTDCSIPIKDSDSIEIVHFMGGGAPSYSVRSGLGHSLINSLVYDRFSS